jgi:hypothetical protein
LRVSIFLYYGNVGAELEGANKVGRLSFFELHCAVFEGKERVVGAYANVFAGVDFGTALANDNFTRGNGGTVGAFYAETLGLRIATISCRTLG